MNQTQTVRSKRTPFKWIAAILLAVLALSLALGCARTDIPDDSERIENLTWKSADKNEYAHQFRLDRYEDKNSAKYILLTVFKADRKTADSKWLILPENASAPEGLSDSIEVLTVRDRERIFVSSSPTMALLNALGALDRVAMTTNTTWYVPEIKAAVKSANNPDGTIVDVGKYKTPDYELITDTAKATSSQAPVTFAPFSTMLDEADGVKESLASIGLRTMRDESTSESHPLGRTEWIKVYGELFGKQAKAKEVFDAQVKLVKDSEEKIKDLPDAEKKTAVIFYVTTSKVYYVRNSGDYVTEMLNLAGGKHITNVGENEPNSTQMNQEQFYAQCMNADFVIYNASTGGRYDSVDGEKGLIAGRLGDWFRDFKAYKNDNIWRTSDDFYQATDKLGNMIADINNVLYGTDVPDRLTYLWKIPKTA